MTVADQVLSALASIGGGSVPVCGRVADEIGDPVPAALVRALAVGAFAGHERSRAETDAAGVFALPGLSSGGFVIVVEALGSEARLALAAPRADVGTIRLLPPLRLTASVGDGGDNRPRDLRRLQHRLLRLGRLTPDDVAAEPIDPDAAPPVAPGPRLLAALADQLASRLGRRPPRLLVEPGTPFAEAVVALPPFPTARLALAEPVGALPGAAAPSGNGAPAFARVQDRLRQLGLLRPSDHAAEAVDPAAAAPIDPATRPLTVAAIATLQRRMAGSALRAIVPGTAGARLLDDPASWGRRALALADRVGAGGANRPDDVRRVQQRLWLLGHLTSAELAAERPAAAASAALGDAALLRTIAALRAMREQRLGEAAPAPGLVDPLDAALRRLQEPAPLALRDLVAPIPWGAANRADDVRAVQDRLLWLGLLSEADHATERVDPAAPGRIDFAVLTKTTAALADIAPLHQPFALSAAVGRGATNAAADVRAVQDRCLALRQLAEADHVRERADPDAGGVVDDAALAATFAAIEALRQRLLGLPAAQPGQPWTAQARVEPGDETEAMLRAPLFFGRAPLRLGGSVGSAGWNFPADVRAVQDRLRMLRLLAPADHAREAVDALQPQRVADGALPATCTAIARLRRALLGETGPQIERIELRSAALQSLDDPLGALRAPLPLAGSGGWDGDNAPADVLLVLDRLHGLGFLGDDDHALETGAARAAAGGAAVRDADIAVGIDAIGRWQQLMLGGVAEPCLAPWTAALHTLAWPPCPRPAELALGAAVGRGAANRGADVRVLQDRLFELGVLAAADYVAERADPAAATVPAAALGATIAAIEQFQRTAAGHAVVPPDGRADPGGLVQRVLRDPAYGTPTAPNPDCALAVAGPARPVFAVAALRRIALAIEQGEGGSASGETPALLRNASGTPASFGRSQVIGGTCIALLGSHPALAAHYGLDAAALAALADVAAQTAALFATVQALQPPPAGWTEAELQAAIDAHVQAHAADVRRDCGLGPADIANVFRAMQLRRHLQALPAAQATAVLFDAATHPDAAANMAALGIGAGDADTYRRNPAFHGEHRAGFVTRALFHAVDGQAVRDALTDDSGSRLGLLLIEQNWNATAGLGLAERDRAMLTAYLHNHGGAAADLATHFATVTGDAYTQAAIARYDALPP